MARTIKQTVMFRASPHEIFEALMDTKLHAKFTGAGASISRKVGGRFSAHDGYIEGTNVQLVKDNKIVQKWRGNDWPKGHYSTATFTLEKTKDGTKLKFTQTGVPDKFHTDISHGWHEFYWQPMKKML